jgi:hypothetical protein
MEFLGGVQPENVETTLYDIDASDYLPIKETDE